MLRMMSKDHGDRPRLQLDACGDGDLVRQMLKREKMGILEGTQDLWRDCAHTVNGNHAANRNGPCTLDRRNELAEKAPSFFFFPSPELLPAGRQILHVERFSQPFCVARA